ncbi:MAG: tRNA (guanosine(46)-N7)-methyltransferase TrmB [Ruminococcaceae bacterium]|nr:tRNA (guanosine(46)-N7)-methyltransferase TrmB [Oscillospiraceae bacterium]
MRMRKKKNGAQRIAACSHLLVPSPEALAAPELLFDADRPLHLEIGCGKGNFACGMAEKHPDVNFIAMERVSDVCCVALEKAVQRATERPHDNLRFMIGDAKLLGDCMKPASVSCLYLNFSDPWPKKGHAKRRLTHASFLAIYRRLLTPDGVIKLKTDNEGLFASSLEQFELCGMEILYRTDDLHASPLAEGNVMTEYEKNFSDKGMPIHAVHARFRPEENTL